MGLTVLSINNSSKKIDFKMIIRVMIRGCVGAKIQKLNSVKMKTSSELSLSKHDHKP